MQLFNNFDNVPEDYVPNNMFPPAPPSINIKLVNSNVRELYKCGKLIGYAWRYGEDVAIDFTNSIIVTLPAGSLTSRTAGDEPSVATVGAVGQKYYNLTDIKSWTMTSVITVQSVTTYVWTQDEYFTYTNDGPVEETIQVPMVNKANIVELLNFRREVVLEKEFLAQQDFTFTLTPEESKEYLRGIYFIRIYVTSTTEESLMKEYEIHIE